MQSPIDTIVIKYEVLLMLFEYEQASVSEVLWMTSLKTIIHQRLHLPREAYSRGRGEDDPQMPTGRI